MTWNPAENKIKVKELKTGFNENTTNYNWGWG